MKHRKMFTVGLAVLLLFALSGCQLAREDGGGDHRGDRLVGVLITQAYLDLNDMEGHISDNIRRMPASGEVFIAGSDSRYQGRLYAALKTRSLTDSRGEAFSKEEYIFDSVEGISFFAAVNTAAGDSYVSVSGDEAIHDGHTGLHYSDTEKKILLEGTIYISSNHTNTTFFVNPVYQSSDGQVYAVAGNGLSTGGVRSEGAVYAQTMEETTTLTENRTSKQIRTKVNISFAVMNPSEKIVVLQMDQASNKVSQAEYAPGALPRVITPEAGAAFLIVETHKRDQQGNLSILRIVYDKSNQAIDTFYCRDDGICIKQWTQLDWSRH